MTTYLEGFIHYMLTGYDIYHHLNLKHTASLFGIYIGKQEISGTWGPLKIGRCSNAVALQRGRSQGGANWWFFSYYVVPNRETTWVVEGESKPLLRAYRMDGAQRQRELYDMPIVQARLILENLVYNQTNQIIDVVDQILTLNLHK
jgi:hypothetical protein